MGLYPKWVNYYMALLGIPQGPYSQWYFVDPVNGSDNNNGRSFRWPLKTVAAAYALCTADQHDAVIMLSGDTADNPAATLTWAKDYTHLVGLSTDLAGVGQRCRIVGTAALDLSPLFDLQSNGCVIRNIQFYNGKDANTDSLNVRVTGSRNHFKNVFFAGMAHATPAARAGSSSLALAGSENLFEDCAIGLDTIVRGAGGPPELLVYGGARNTFRRCRIFDYSETDHALVSITNMDRWIEFEDCIFHNFSVNWAVTMTNAFTVTAAATHQVIMRGNNQLVGITGWSDTLTHIYSTQPAPHNTFGTVVNPAA